jgi:hypothetical protein
VLKAERLKVAADTVVVTVLLLAHLLNFAGLELLKVTLYLALFELIFAFTFLNDALLSFIFLFFKLGFFFIDLIQVRLLNFELLMCCLGFALCHKILDIFDP